MLSAQFMPTIDVVVPLWAALGTKLSHLGQLSEPQPTVSVCLIPVPVQVSQVVASDIALSVGESSGLSRWLVQQT